MALKTCTLILIFVANFRLCQSKKSYENYTLFNVVATNMDQLKFLQNLGSKKYVDVIFWKKPYNKLYEDVHLLVNPVDKDLFLERLQHFKMSHSVLIENVDRAFSEQKVSQYLRSRPETFNWDNYYSLKDIYEWILDLAERYPQIMTVESIGQTEENRDIYAVGIKRSSYPRAKVIVEGGVHGHEWISIAFVTYLINELINASSSKLTKFKFIANEYEWYLIPVVNPDGYEFSMTEDRLWRKNRRNFSDGIGVDLDRNFNYIFGKHDSINISSDPFYCGPSPHSEKETYSLVKFINAKRSRLKYYFSIHSYGQRLIIPYGDRLSHNIENYPEMENFAKQAALKMYKLYGDKYKIGTAFDTLGARVSGNSGDYVKQNFNVEYVFTWLLRDNGSYGFALPSAEIETTCEETLIGMAELMTAKVKYMRADFYSGSSSLESSFLLTWITVFVLL